MDKIINVTACYAFEGSGTLYDEGEDFRRARAERVSLGMPTRIMDAYVFVTTDRGDVLARAMKYGEHAAEVADHYRRRGWTDAGLDLVSE